MNKFAVILVCLALSACGGLPKRKEINTDAPSILEILAAPEGADVWVDGARVGIVEKKRARFPIAPGTRKVKIYTDGRALFEREVFVEKGSTRQVDLKPIK